MKDSHIAGLIFALATSVLGLSVGVPIGVAKYESSKFYKNELAQHLVGQKFSISPLGKQYYHNGCWIQTLRNILQAFGKDIGNSEKDFYEEHYCGANKNSTTSNSVRPMDIRVIMDYLNKIGIRSGIINIKHVEKDNPQIDNGIIELLSRYFENNGNKPIGICLNWHWISIQDIKENVVIIYDSLNNDRQCNIIIKKENLGEYLRKKVHGTQLDVLAPFVCKQKFDELITYNALNGGFEGGEIENFVSNNFTFRDENNIPMQLICFRDLDGKFFIGNGPNKKHKLKSTKQDELIDEISKWYSSLEKDEQKQWVNILP